MEKIVVTIIGSKNFNNYNFFEEKLYQILGEYFEKEYKIIIREQEINNVDTFAIRFAKENNCILQRYKIKWDEYGKSAGYINLKRLLFGDLNEDNQLESCDIICCFYSEYDKNSDRIMQDTLIESAKGVLLIEPPYGLNIQTFIE